MSVSATSEAMTIKQLVLWVEALLEYAARESMDKAALRLWSREVATNNEQP